MGESKRGSCYSPAPAEVLDKADYKLARSGIAESSDWTNGLVSPAHLARPQVEVILSTDMVRHSEDVKASVVFLLGFAVLGRTSTCLQALSIVYAMHQEVPAPSCSPFS